MTGKYLEINGARLWYEEAGQGLPVIFVHAGIADQRMWDDQFPVFARKYRAIRYDSRGYGQSPMVAGQYSSRADLYGVMKALGVERAALIGCSMGGMAVIDFAVEHPEMTAALIPVAAGLSGFPYDENFMPPLLEEIIAADKAGDKELLNELEIRFWVDGLNRGPDAVDPAVRAKVLEMNRTALDISSGVGEAMPLEPPAYGRLDAIQAPALVIYGDEDVPETRDVALHLGAELPNARVVCITGTAHLPNMERPEEFNQVVLSFLEGKG